MQPQQKKIEERLNHSENQYQEKKIVPKMGFRVEVGEFSQNGQNGFSSLRKF